MDVLYTLAIVAMFAASLIAGGPNVMQWDNFEFLTPLIYKTHERRLNGEIPLSNFTQHMGDPL